MARTRYIKPGLFENDEFEELSNPDQGRLLFLATICLADRNGVFLYRPRRIGAFAFPYREVDVRGLLAGMTELGFYQRIKDETGRRLLRVTNFVEHQSPHPKEQEITIGETDIIPAEPDFFSAKPDLGTNEQVTSKSRRNYSLEVQGKKEEKAGKKEADDWFEEQFWPKYPLKVAKQDAKKAARKIPADLRPAVIAARDAQLRWPADMPGGLNPQREKLPHATTWINQERWADEIPEAPIEAVKRETKRTVARLVPDADADPERIGDRVRAAVEKMKKRAGGGGDA